MCRRPAKNFIGEPKPSPTGYNNRPFESISRKSLVLDENTETESNGQGTVPPGGVLEQGSWEVFLPACPGESSFMTPLAARKLLHFLSQAFLNPARVSA